MNERHIEDIVLPQASPGSRRSLRVIRYGSPSASRKAYIQAGLHAGETPGMLVTHHLAALLDTAAAAGDITAAVTLVPCANPIGLAQWRHESIAGRFDANTGINFNRAFIDSQKAIADRVTHRLGNDPSRNTELIRRAAGEIFDAMPEPLDETAALKQHLLTLAFDADVVLDLHCDAEAIVHVYLGKSLWPMAADLPAQMGAGVTLLADDSGVTPFDEACSRYWWQLAQRFPTCPVTPACLAATVELRGEADVDHRLAETDARNIFTFLQRRGFVGGTAPPVPQPSGEARPLTAVEDVKAPAAGVVVFRRQPGDTVAAGDPVAEIVDPLGGERRTLVARRGGILYSRISHRFARPGLTLARIAGSRPVKKNGAALLPL